MKKIGIDLDEILSDTITSVLAYHKSINKTAFKKEKFSNYNYWEVWGGTRENAIKLINDYNKTEYFRNIQPIPGAYEELLELKKEGYEFDIITGRSSEFEKQTQDWINKYYPNIFSGIYFANIFSENKVAEKKSDICKKLDIKILIEDDPTNIIECANVGIKVLYLDYPWNKEVNNKNSTRLYSWKEISKNIKKYI